MRQLALGIALLALCSCSQHMARAPKFLKPGDKVAIVAPSYTLPDSLISLACDRLRKEGLEPVVGKNISCLYPEGGGASHYAGTVSERVEDLVNAYNDPEIKAIICARGGYGAIQDLQEMDLKTIRRHPKWLVGYSDVTALHLASVKAGVMSIHGNMCNKLAAEAAGRDTSGAAAAGNRMMLDILMGKAPEYDIPVSKYNVEGTAEGRLIGGNMITLLTMMGSDYDCFAKGDWILFVEEVEESMHAIDRLFNMLKMQDRMKNIKGIIFCDFTDCGREFAWKSVNAMLDQYTRDMGIPVCYGFPAGHGPLNLPLIEGAKVRLSVEAEKVGVSYPKLWK